MPLSPDGQPVDDFLSEEDAHRVLARAVELDTRTVSDVSVAQLRSIAAEAGIKAEALDRALREFRVGSGPEPSQTANGPRWSVQLRRFRRPAALTAFGVAAAATPGDFLVLSALASVPLYALYELCIYLVQKGEHGGPSSRAAGPPVAHATDAGTRSQATDRGTRSLSLRARSPAQAV